MEDNTASHKSLSLFISYVSKDEGYLDELEIHLKTLVRQGLVSSWSRKKLMPGAEAQAETIHKLKTSDIILLMISPDLIGSDDFWEVEMPIALERHSSLDSVVVPILLRSVYWEETPIAQLQVLPRNKKPVQAWDNHDVAYSCITAEIREVVEEIHYKRINRLKYKQFLEQKIGKEHEINQHLRSLLQEFGENLSLSAQETSLIENSVLSTKRIEDAQKYEKLHIYGLFYREQRLQEKSLAVLRPILDKKLAELSLNALQPEVLRLEKSIDAELFPATGINRLKLYIENFLGKCFELRRPLIITGSGLVISLGLTMLITRPRPDETSPNNGNLIPDESSVSLNQPAPLPENNNVPKVSNPPQESVLQESVLQENNEPSLDSYRSSEAAMSPTDFFQLYLYRVDHGLYEEAFQLLSDHYKTKIYFSKGFSPESALADFKAYWDKCDLEYQNLYQGGSQNGEATIYYQSQLFCNDDHEVGRSHNFKSKKMTLVRSGNENGWEIKDVVDN